jgi:hypothetical protein
MPILTGGIARTQGDMHAGAGGAAGIRWRQLLDGRRLARCRIETGVVLLRVAPASAVFGACRWFSAFAEPSASGPQTRTQAFGNPLPLPPGPRPAEFGSDVGSSTTASWVPMKESLPGCTTAAGKGGAARYRRRNFRIDSERSVLNNHSLVSRPKWRNWQTRRIQNPVRFTPGEGSIPSFGIRPLCLRGRMG